MSEPELGISPDSGRVVLNSGPLITLATIGRLDLLKGLFARVYIPEAVYDEVVVRGKGEPGSREVDAAEWIETCVVKDRFSVSLLRDELGAGESETIVLAQELGARYVILDDKMARRKTIRLGLPTVGTLGVLLMSKEAGLIAQVKPILDELRKTDFRMNSTGYREVLVKAHEMT